MLDTIKKSPIKIGIILAVLIIVNVVGWYIYFNWDTPLGEPLNLPTLTTEPQIQNTQTSTPEVVETEGVGATETPEIVFTPTIEPVCGNDTSMTILVTGVDAEDYLYGLADSIRVVRLDFQRKKVTVLALPRDLWVDIPGAAPHATQGKLNQAYLYGTEGMGFYSGGGNGSGLLAHTLLSNYGLSIDHYLSVNIYAFREIIDGLGGIDVYLPEEVYIKHFDQPKLYLETGNHHLDGKQAEQVVRTRIVAQDAGRIQNQTIILRAVAVKMLTPNGIKILPELTNRLLAYVLTDFSASDVSQMACLAAMIDSQEDIIFENLIPMEEVDNLTGWVMDEVQGFMVNAIFYDKELLTQKLAEFQAGTWPTQE